jgi:uncharacterized membrane protein YgaE (UPF0421/DUF939 family)
MTLNLDNEAILKQLGITAINDTLLNQVSAIRENTNKFEIIEKHIFDLHKKLEKINGYIALSNSKNYLKIKHHDSSNRVQNNEFTEIVTNWANKYKVSLEKVPNKSTYYILGLNH